MLMMSPRHCRCVFFVIDHLSLRRVRLSVCSAAVAGSILSPRHAGIASGTISHDQHVARRSRATSRVTVKTKSKLVWYMLNTLSTIPIMMPGRTNDDDDGVRTQAGARSSKTVKKSLHSPTTAVAHLMRSDWHPPKPGAPSPY
jgi:hypothetical protein